MLHIVTAERLIENLIYLPWWFQNVSVSSRSMPGRQIARGEVKLTAEVTAIYTPVWHQLCGNYAVIRDNFTHDTGLDKFSQRNKQLLQEKQNICKLDNHGWDKMRIYFFCFEEARFATGSRCKISSWVAEGCKRVAGIVCVKFIGVDGT